MEAHNEAWLSNIIWQW